MITVNPQEIPEVTDPCSISRFESCRTHMSVENELSMCLCAVQRPLKISQIRRRYPQGKLL